MFPSDSKRLRESKYRLAPGRVCQISTVAGRFDLQLLKSIEFLQKHQSAFHLCPPLVKAGVV